MKLIINFTILKKLNYKIVKFDPKFAPITDIKKNKADIIFNALHGKGGEDGTIQSFFEYIGLPYTHSGPVSSMILMNKYFSKKISLYLAYILSIRLI